MVAVALGQMILVNKALLQGAVSAASLKDKSWVQGVWGARARGSLSSLRRKHKENKLYSGMLIRFHDFYFSLCLQSFH